MRQRIVELKVIKREFCYGDEKVSKGELKEFVCPFGFNELIAEKCNHCRYIAEKIISKEEIKELKEK